MVKVVCHCAFKTLNYIPHLGEQMNYHRMWWFCSAGGDGDTGGQTNDSGGFQSSMNTSSTTESGRKKI